MGLGVARCAPYWLIQKLSDCSIRRFLLADVCADLFQFEPDGGHRVTAGPEMLARKVSFFAAQAGSVRPVFRLAKRFFAGFSVSHDGRSILDTQIDRQATDLMLVEKLSLR